MPKDVSSRIATPRAGGRQLAVLSELARIATEDLTLRPMLQRITDALAEKLDWEMVSLVTVDAESGRFHCEALSTREPVDLWVGYSRELGSGVVGEVALTGKPIVLDDVRLSTNYVETMPGALSELCVPVKHRGEVVAILNLESRRPGAFRHRLPLADAIAEQIAGAIWSARLFEQVRRRAAHLEILSDVSRAALEAGELAAVLEHIADYVRQKFDFYLVAIVVADEAGSEWEHRAFASRRPLAMAPRAHWPTADGVVGRAIRSGETQLVVDVGRDPDYFAIDDAVRAELVVPIRFRERIFGAFNIESDDPAVFTDETRTVVELLAAQVAGAIQLALLNKRLSETTRALGEANRRLSDVNRALERLSLSDSLTGLANRRHFDESLAVESRRLARTGEPLALLLIDVDCFKDYNDTYGHLRGDDCLRQVARELLAGVQRAGDLVARYGGEEFAVILPTCDLAAAAQIGESLRARIEGAGIEHRRSSVGKVLTLSVGVAAGVPARDRAPEELVFAADKALYQAKRGGRNRVVVAPEERRGVL